MYTFVMVYCSFFLMISINLELDSLNQMHHQQ